MSNSSGHSTSVSSVANTVEQSGPTLGIGPAGIVIAVEDSVKSPVPVKKHNIPLSKANLRNNAMHHVWKLYRKHRFLAINVLNFVLLLIFTCTLEYIPALLLRVTAEIVTTKGLLSIDETPLEVVRDTQKGVLPPSVTESVRLLT